MIISLYALCFCLLACGLVVIFLQKKRAEEQLKIRSLCEKVQTALESTQATGKHPLFATSLSQAEMTTKLQKTRIELQSGARGGAPEKYTFFSNLVAKGMNADEIAEILDISTTEASQLVQLCGLTGCRS